MAMKRTGDVVSSKTVPKMTISNLGQHGISIHTMTVDITYDMVSQLSKTHTHTNK